MDIYAIQSHMKKILAYVEDIQKSHTRMYSKSRAKLEDLSNSCLYLLDMLSDILGDEVFAEKDEEFTDIPENLSGTTLLQEMESKLSNLPILTKQGQVSNMDRKIAFAKYAAVLKQVASQHIGYNHVSTCAKMIWNWFDSRFIESHSKFKYGMKQIPSWIQSIVIMYGKKISEDKDVQFVDEFEDWCKSLTETDIRYPLPYDVYQVAADKQGTYTTLTSVVLWDILLDNGYSDLCNNEPYQLYPKQDSIYRYCGVHRPSVLDRYVNYKQDSSILTYCGLEME